MFNLLRIEVIGLYKQRDYEIKIDQNRLIIVGDNGSGKTTIIKIIFAALSCNWDVLRTYPFSEIRIVLNTNTISIKSELLNKIFSIEGIERLDYVIERKSSKRTPLTDSLLEAVISIKRQLDTKKTDFVEIDSIYTHRLPYDYIKDVVSHPAVKQLYAITLQIEKAFENVKLLYLPTYRRIEEQLSTVFPEADKEEWDRAKKRLNKARTTELVEFGMQDVDGAVKEFQNHLRALSQEQQSILTLGYLSEIVSAEYDHVDIEAIKRLSAGEINEVLSRIESRILSEEKKSRVSKILTDVRSEAHGKLEVLDKIVCHYFLKLLEFHRDITNAEIGMRTFQDICNKYLINNCINYDSQNFTCHVINKVHGEINNDNEIKFQNLSSGEKQIVSVFSYLNLNKEDSVFVIIDEPELSLAVDWQKTFLVDIINSSKCCGLLATTHSPFTFDNELIDYVHGINEFCVRG